MTLNEELSKSGLVSQALRGRKARRDAYRFRKRVGDEIAQCFTGTYLHEEPDSVLIPKGLDIIHPMDGRFQVGHQDSPDLIGI
jgi:hypothetical protein